MEEEQKPAKKKQNRRSRNSAREVNRMFTPEIIDPEGERKLGRGIAKNRRDFHAVVMRLNATMVKADPNLPKDVSALHYAVVSKLTQTALRDNLVPVDMKCPHCSGKMSVPLTDARNEKNSVQALETLADRMFPKLASLSHEVNVSGQILSISEEIMSLVVRYVPFDKKAICLGEINLLIEKMKNAAENQNNSSELPLLLTGTNR